MTVPAVPDISRLKRRLAAVLSAAAVLLAAVSWAYYAHHRASLKADAERLLLSTGQIKLEQLLNWRREHLSDAMLLADSPVFSAYARRLVPGQDGPEAAALARKRLESFIAHKKYPSAAVTDENGRVLVYAGEKPGAMGPRFASLARAALSAGAPQMGEFYLSGKDASPRIDIAAAVGGGSRRLLLLRVDPAVHLYPLLQSWSAKRETGEILLAGRDGGEVLFLNELRHMRDSALRLRFSLDEPQLPAAMGLRGGRGIVSGRDYRGVKVLASITPVDGTSWALVTKMDLSEVMAGSAEVGVLLALLLLSLLGAAGALAFLLFKRQAEVYECSYAEMSANYRLLNEKANDCILVIDMTARKVLEANRKACETYGYTPEEMRGLEAETVIPERDRGAFRERISETLRKGSRIYEAEHRRKNGEVFPVEISASLVEAPGGRQMFVIVRDISERRRTERELADLSRQRQLAMDAARLGWWRYVPSTGMSFYDERYKEIFEVSGSGQPNDEIIKRLHPEDLPGVWARVEAALDPARRENYSAEYRINLPDGRVKWVGAYGLAIFDGEGGSARALELVGTVQDITGRRRMEQALAASEERFRSMFEKHTSVMLLISPEDGRIIDANLAAERFYGYTRDRLRELKISDINMAPPAEVAGLVRGVDSGDNAHFEARHRLAGGDVRVVDVHGASVDTASGRVNFAVIHDITDKVNAERQVLKLNTELQSKNKELEDFLYVTTHDLRSPLVNIQGFSQNLSDHARVLHGHVESCGGSGAEVKDLVAAKMPEALKYITESAAKMDRLISALLRLSRAGRAPARPERLEMNALVDQVFGLFSFRAGSEGAELRRGELPACLADREMLNQVFSNLVENSFKYAVPGRPLRLEVSGRVEGRTAVYEVRDNGRGIAPEQIDKIWKIFYRAEGDRSVPGEGLGLALVKGLLERNGGKARAASEQGKGSVFSVELPAG